MLDLTPREREIMDLLARGFGNREIAAALGIKANTVKVMRRSILAKYGVATTLEAVAAHTRRTPA